MEFTGLTDLETLLSNAATKEKDLYKLIIKNYKRIEELNQSIPTADDKIMMSAYKVVDDDK